ALGISRSGGARNPHVFQYTLRFLRSGGTRPSFARDDFFTSSQGVHFRTALYVVYFVWAVWCRPVRSNNIALEAWVPWSMTNVATSRTRAKLGRHLSRC
ncbi:MAG: hypothetical protein ACREYF_14565, partial [Gammaproteobacteria bacterium]